MDQMITSRSRRLSYSQLKTLKTLEDRYFYLKLNGTVGKTTFGWDRYYNQRFYHSLEWRQVRDQVIVRDLGCDLGVPGFEIGEKKILIHHMNPIWVEDLKRGNPDILNPEYLISVSDRTHQAIHYGSENLLPPRMTVRFAGDTKLW